MAIIFTCKYCKKEIEAKYVAGGETIGCRFCGKLNIVPQKIYLIQRDYGFHCSSCDSNNPLKAIKCSNCGDKFNATLKECSDCKALNNVDAQFCRKCGKDSLPKPPQKVINYCEKCGTEYEPDDIYCEKDGTKLILKKVEIVRNPPKPIIKESRPSPPSHQSVTNTHYPIGKPKPNPQNPKSNPNPNPRSNQEIRRKVQCKQCGAPNSILANLCFTCGATLKEIEIQDRVIEAGVENNPGNEMGFAIANLWIVLQAVGSVFWIVLSIYFFLDSGEPLLLGVALFSIPSAVTAYGVYSRSKWGLYVTYGYLMLYLLGGTVKFFPDSPMLGTIQFSIGALWYMYFSNRSKYFTN